MLIGTKCSKSVCYIETLQNVSVQTLFNQQRKWNPKSHIKRSLMNFILMRSLQSGLRVYEVEKLREYHHTGTQVDKHHPRAAQTFSFCVLDPRQVSAWLRCTVLAGPLEKSEIHLRGQHLWLSVSKFILRGLRQVLQCRNSSSFLGPGGFSKDCGFSFHPLKGQKEREGVCEGSLEHSIMLREIHSFRTDWVIGGGYRPTFPESAEASTYHWEPLYHGKAVVWGNQTPQLTQRFKRIPILSWEKSHPEIYWRPKRNPEHLRNDFSPQDSKAKLNRQLHWYATLRNREFFPTRLSPKAIHWVSNTETI